MKEEPLKSQHFSCTCHHLHSFSFLSLSESQFSLSAFCFFFLRFTCLWLMCEWLPACMCTHAHDAHRGPKRASDTLELELQQLWAPVWVVELNRVLSKRSQCSPLLHRLSSRGIHVSSMTLFSDPYELFMSQEELLMSREESCCDISVLVVWLCLMSRNKPIRQGTLDIEHDSNKYLWYN